MSRWFRWYEGTSEDGKFRVVARMSRVTVRDVIALWAFMLEDAAHLDHRGVCKRNEDFMASILDFEDGVVERILEAMENADMISVGHGAITICNWGKRQFEGDYDPTAADRQARKRARDKEATKESNAPVTRDSRPPETDTETNTEKKEDRPKRVRTVCSPEFEEFWKAYPRTPNMAKAEAWKAWGRLSSDDQIAATAAVPKYRAWLKPDHPIVHACRFLSQRRFDGFNEPDPAENVIPFDTNKFYAKFGSPELDAWDAYSRKTKGTNMIRDKRGGWLCDARWPPDHEQATG
jgi:hypothetical protein